MAKSELNDMMQTPLNGQTYQSESLTVQELSLCSKVVLRADFDQADTCAAIENTFGLSPAIAANTFNTNADSSMHWMGPDERLLYSESQDPETLTKTLRTHLPEGKSAVGDVSDYYTCLLYTSPSPRDLSTSRMPSSA